MRCYFLRNARIEAVELLKAGPDDKLIEQAKDLFRERASQGYDSVEVWTGRRFVYRSRQSRCNNLSGPTFTNLKGTGRGA